MPLGLDRRAIISIRSVCCRRPNCAELHRARTKHIRLARRQRHAAASPDRVAEQWATLDLLSAAASIFASGRGYDSREYAPFHVDFANNQTSSKERQEVLKKLWGAEGRRIDHHGKHYQFEDVRITPQPIQKPLPVYIGHFPSPR